MIDVVLSQPNYQLGPKHLKNFYLPYTVATIWSYVKNNPNFSNQLNLKEIIFKRDIIDNLINKWKNVDILFCSTYIWNENYNKELSKKVKNKWPKCLVVWGGPQPDHTDKNFFKNFPFVDIICTSEGEPVIEKIIEQTLSTKNYTTVPNIKLNQQGVSISTTIQPRIEIENHPSPYLLGIFDPILKKHPSFTWSTVLETNRGCPYGCTYCDWGSLTSSKIKMFGLQKVFDEIDWISKNKIEFVYIADANFGILKQRDILIAKKIRSNYEKFNFPKFIELNTLKMSNEIAVELGEILHPMLLALSLSQQSLNKETLEYIKRYNMKSNDFNHVIQLCKMHNLKYLSELIIPLPKETKTTFMANFFKLYEQDVNMPIYVYPLVYCNNSPLKLFDKYQIKTSSIPYQSGQDEDEIIDFLTVGIETEDMSFDDFIEVFWFWHSQLILHQLGYSKHVSEYCYKNYNIHYETFYKQFYKILDKTSFWNEIKLQTVRLLKNSYGKDKTNSLDARKIESFAICQGLNAKEKILKCLKKLLSQLKISEVKKLMIHARFETFDKNTVTQFPILTNEGIFTYEGPYITSINEYSEFLAHRKDKNFIKYKPNN